MKTYQVTITLGRDSFGDERREWTGKVRAEDVSRALTIASPKSYLAFQERFGKSNPILTKYRNIHSVVEIQDD